MKRIFLFSFSIVFLIFIVANINAQTEIAKLWAETGVTEYAKNETVSLQVSVSSSATLISACLFDGQNVCQALPSVKGAQAGFSILPEVGEHTFVAKTITANGSIISNPVKIIIRNEEVQPTIDRIKFESNGWFRIFGDYNKDGNPEWSKPFKGFFPDYFWEIPYSCAFQVQEIKEITLRVETRKTRKTDLKGKFPIGTSIGWEETGYGEKIVVTFPTPTSTFVTLSAMAPAKINMAIDEIPVYQWLVRWKGQTAPPTKSNIRYITMGFLKQEKAK